MPRIANESIQRVVDANDIVDVIGSYIPLKRAGSDFKASCPFHKERTPSFTISPSRQVYHCFGCGAGGGVIRFVQDYEHLGFADAVRKLAQRAGVHLLEESGGGGGEQQDVERGKLLEIHAEAAKWYHGLLFEDKRAKVARDYLRKRGIDGAVAARWTLGFAPPGGDEFFGFAKKGGFRENDLLRSGLCGKAEESGRVYDRFRGRVMIPIHNDYGEIVAFSGRILDAAASPAKYVNSPETPIFTKGKILFGLHKSKRALAEKECAIVCEGQFDLIAAYEAGVENVIASQGTAFTAQQASLLRRFAPTAVLCFDADAAGQKAVDRSLPHLLGQGLGVKVLALPTGEDPDSLIRSEGGARFAERVASAREIIDYQLDRIEMSGVLTGAAGVSKAAHRMAEILKMIPDAVHRDAAAGQIAVRLGVTSKQLHQLATKSPGRREDDDPSEEAPRQEALQLGESCIFLCRASIRSTEVREWLRARTEPSVKDLGEGWELLAKIVASDFSPDDKAGFATFLAQCPAREQAALAAMDERFFPTDILAAAKEFWGGLRKQRLIEFQEKVKTKLLQKNLPTEEILKIQKQLLDIRQRLQELASPI